MDAVDAAVFCNHCGARMRALCPDCAASNPPESRFCHRCGATLSSPNAPITPYPYTSRQETGIKDIGADLKTLGRDVTAYSAPRIKRSGVATIRNAKVIGIAAGRRSKAAAKSAAPRVKSLAQRFKPYQPEPTAPPAIPTDYVVDGVANHEPTQTRRIPSDFAVTCPRCHRVSEPGALFCFSCGLPLDDVPAAVDPLTTYAGTPAGFWVRLVAWLIDFIILGIVQGILIAIWPGLFEYFSSDSYGHPVDLLIFVVDTLYFTIGVAVWSTTIGKRALGLYVLRPDGSKVGGGRAMARYFAGILSALLIGIGYLMIGLRSDKRGLHDLICDTVVVRK